MKKNKFLALTMLCSTLCGIPTKAQEIKDSGIQKVSGETDSSKKDKTPSLKKNDKQISQINTKKVLGLWAIHETLSYFGGNFGQFYHKPARLSVVGVSRWIGERRNNKNLKKKYKQLIDCLKNNIKVMSFKRDHMLFSKNLGKEFSEKFLKDFSHGQVVVHKNNLRLSLSTLKENKTRLENETESVRAAKKLFKASELETENFFKNFVFICKYDDKEVFIGLINSQYFVNNFGMSLKSEDETDNEKFCFAKKFLFSHTCEQLNEWSKSDYSPIVTLHYKKYDSIDSVPNYEDVKELVKKIELNI